MAYDRCFIYQSSSTRGRSSRRYPSHGAHKRELNTKIHLAVDSFGMPVRVIVTDGTVADCPKAGELIERIDADYLLADRGYDTDNVIEQADSAKMEAVIPPKNNRKNQRKYDKNIYENRYQVEKSFLKMKGWRGIAVRYSKTSSSYRASVQIRCMFMRLNILWRHHLGLEFKSPQARYFYFT